MKTNIRIIVASIIALTTSAFAGESKSVQVVEREKIVYVDRPVPVPQPQPAARPGGLLGILGITIVVNGGQPVGYRPQQGCPPQGYRPAPPCPPQRPTQYRPAPPRPEQCAQVRPQRPAQYRPRPCPSQRPPGCNTGGGRRPPPMGVINIPGGRFSDRNPSGYPGPLIQRRSR